MLALLEYAHADIYEATALRGYRFSDTLVDETSGANIKANEAASFGFIVSGRRDRQSFYDFYFSRQDTELQRSNMPANPLHIRLDYYQLGGTVYYEHNWLHPFATGGLGLTRVTAADPAYSAETRASLSVGGGLKFLLSDAVSLRIEARMLGTVIDANGSILCANGSCTATLNGEMYLQFETSAGITFAF